MQSTGRECPDRSGWPQGTARSCRNDWPQGLARSCRSDWPQGCARSCRRDWPQGDARSCRRPHYLFARCWRDTVPQKRNGTATVCPSIPGAAGPVRTRGWQHCRWPPPARGYGAASRVRDVSPAGAAAPSRPCRRQRRRRSQLARRHGEASLAKEVKPAVAAGPLSPAGGSAGVDHPRHDCMELYRS